LISLLPFRAAASYLVMSRRIDTHLCKESIDPPSFPIAFVKGSPFSPRLPWFPLASYLRSLFAFVLRFLHFGSFSSPSVPLLCFLPLSPTLPLPARQNNHLFAWLFGSVFRPFLATMLFVSDFRLPARFLYFTPDAFTRIDVFANFFIILCFPIRFLRPLLIVSY